MSKTYDINAMKSKIVQKDGDATTSWHPTCVGFGKDMQGVQK
eukprot:CAMPEP_0114670892 /NCGR_PEP_ID=MMETSP0191-20121206/40198_1 /TAXON_ID=126664 /ORGANISM="Sorites sp." /LENGTH=41 /DNA_ID= /DNA_START= /DNA_END= /DNA_ORIENTATION=